MHDDVTTLGFDLEGRRLDTIIGPYRLVRQIGEGGMGVVFHAQQLQPIRREVALKIIKPGMDSKSVISRFETERQALALMDHPNIARVFDAGATSSGLPYFVMELVDGIPISQYCQSKRLSIRDRIDLFITVCQAIQHAHQKGIIHRDIKPSNILIAEHEGKPISKVIDFGLAKALGQELRNETMVSNVGTVVGTLEYMSPEQAELTRHDIDTRTDVYSLGAVLYELLTGTTPIKCDHAEQGYVEMLQRIRQQEPVQPSVRVRAPDTLPDVASGRTEVSRLRKVLHGELDWIVMKALEKDRARRYETVNGLARDLERYLGGQPVEAGPPSGSYRLRKFVARHRLGLCMATAFAVLLIAAVVVSAWLAIRARRAEAEARAVNDFLRNDVLSEASTTIQAERNTKPDPDLKVRAALDRAAARIEGKFASDPVVEASIRQTIGNTYADLGVYPEAQRHAERALDLRRRVLGEEDPETLRSLDLLGFVYDREAKYSQAEPLLIKSVEVRSRVLGERHPETLESLLELAIHYERQGKYAQSESLYLKVLESQRAVLGPEHPKTLASINGLVNVYYGQGKLEEAEKSASQLLELRQRVLGAEHPNTLRSMNNLAAIYESQRKYAEAEPLYVKTIELERRVLGEDNESTLGAVNNLANLYTAVHNYADAEPLYIRSVEGHRRALGPGHRNTIGSLNALAYMYYEQHRYGDTERIFREAVDAGRDGPNKDHPFVLASIAGLANVYAKEGKYTEASAIYADLLEKRRRVSGVEDLTTLDSTIGLGVVRLGQKKYVEAETLLTEVLKLYERVKPDGWTRFYCQGLLGASLVGQRKFPEAEDLLVSGYEGMIHHRPNTAGDAESGTAWSLDDLHEAEQDINSWIVRLYQNSGRPEKAHARSEETKNLDKRN